MKKITNALNDVNLNSTTSTAGVFNGGFRSLTAPIDLSSAMEYQSEETLVEYHRNKYQGHRYSRDSNACTSIIEDIISEVNGGKTLFFNNGMAAIWTVLWYFAKQQEKIYTIGSFYRKTLTMISELHSRKLMTHTNFTSETDFFENVKHDQSGVLFLESPCNPLLRINNIPMIRKTYPYLKIVYDNTASGIGNEKFSLATNVDFVVTSATKYLSGHNDVLAGYLTTFDDEAFTKIWEIRSTQGNLLHPLSAYLLIRSLKTFDLRFEAQCQNAIEIADKINDMDEVKAIYFPGAFSNIDQSDQFNENYHRRGSMMTVEFEKSLQIDLSSTNLLSTKMAPSFGSTDTLIERPSSMSHHGKTEEQLRELGIHKNVIRLSVGLENPDYILNDIKRIILK